jgi:hypothetical protein
MKRKLVLSTIAYLLLAALAAGTVLVLVFNNPVDALHGDGGRAGGDGADSSQAVRPIVPDLASSGIAMTSRAQGGSGKSYQKRSGLRPFLLGYGTKTYLKMRQNCSARTSCSGKTRLKTQKLADLWKKSSRSRVFMGANSYKINSKLTLSRKQV